MEKTAMEKAIWILEIMADCNLTSERSTENKNIRDVVFRDVKMMLLDHLVYEKQYAELQIRKDRQRVAENYSPIIDKESILTLPIKLD